MKINTSQTDKLIAAIDAAQNGAKMRRLSAEKVNAAIKAAEHELTIQEIPKKHWRGCRIRIEPPAVPNSYKYAAMGTSATIERYPSGWFLVGVGRSWCPKKAYGGSAVNKLELSVEAVTARPTVYRV
jgi:hypothetical protein